MKNAFYFILCLLLLTACTATKEQVGNNSTERKYETALQNVQKSSSTNKITALSTILTTIITEQNIAKDSLKGSEALVDKEKIYAIDEYLIDKIQRATPYITTHKDLLNTLKTEATSLKTFLNTTYFQQGKDHLSAAIQERDKIKSQTAYYEFEKAIKYGGHHTTIDSLQAISLSHSMLVYNVVTKANSDRRYQVNIEDRFRNIENLERKFKTIYYNRNKENIDCSIIVEFSPLIKNNDSRRIINDYQANVQTGTRTERNADGSERSIPVYEKVSGSVIKIEKTSVFQWDVKVIINSISNNCILNSSQFTESISFMHLTVEVSGDERAVPEEYRRFTPERELSETEIVDALIERIYEKVTFNIL